MSIGQIFLVVFSSLGVVHGIMLSIGTWTYDKGNRLANRLLSVLLIVLSFRVGKSVVLEFADHLDTRLVFIGLGMIPAIGPLFFLMSKAIVNNQLRLPTRSLWHFAPVCLGVIFGFWIEEHHTETLPIAFFAGLFAFYYFHLLGYLICTRVFIKKYKATMDIKHRRLVELIFYGLLAVWMVYVLNILDEIVPYVIGPVLYTVIAYGISIVVIKKQYLRGTNEKYKTTPVSDEQANRLFVRAKEILENESLFCDADITLSNLSDRMKITRQVLSSVINSHSGMNFNQFVNQYRIEESLSKLENDPHLTVAAVAFEVGFSSLSSFNTAFKKHTGKTPTEYKAALSK